MVSPVRFAQTASNVLFRPESSEFLIKTGPSGALAEPVAEVVKNGPDVRNTQYVSAAIRSVDTLLALYETAGKLRVNPGVVNLARVNRYDDQTNLVIDLPSYQGDHSRRYWRELLSATEFL